MRRATLQDDAVGAGPGLATTAGSAPRLRPADVQVWEIRLDDQPAEVVAQLRGLLSPDEEERADSFYFERDRRRFVVGRGVLRTLIAQHTGGAPEDVAFRYGGNGKPELAQQPGAEGLYFNLAHSEGLALCALTQAGQIGVDVERIRDLPDWRYIATTCFSAPERRRVEAAAPAEQQREFFRAWTRQEAALKATGVGLGGVPVNTTTVPESANPAFRAAPCPPLKVYPLACEPGYAAAIAVSPAARWLTWQHWDAAPVRGHRHPERRSRRVRLEDAAQLKLHVL